MINHVESINTQKEKDAVLSSMTEGVLVIDNNKKILMINEPGISYLNIESDNPTGCFVDDTIKDENFQIFINTLIKTKTPQKKEIRIKKNMKRFFLVNGTILQGEKMGALIVFSDITKLKQLEKIRQDFVANVSHELKTPITSIVGFLETVQQKNFPKEKRKSFLKKALKHSNRLNAIIDDLLWLSKIESMEDSESFDLTNQPLLGIINGAVDDIKSLKGMEDAKIEVSCDSSIELKADEQLLREAFINLLDNAIKYGDSKKKITITSNINKNLVIKFHNYGIPIPKKYNERIFHRFYRIDKSRSRRQGGTGLGLAIVKHIIFVHGGEISVDSDKKLGTSFLIEIPV
jgi:two-component system phosphate regulon sensor histidine kinase PhoR|tara:strand:- start:3758 stop:4798 length:1041 start_codon:yes stop_codon:yes gene_type:complete